MKQTKKEDWIKELMELKTGNWEFENGIPTEVVSFIDKLLSQSQAQAKREERK